METAVGNRRGLAGKKILFSCLGVFLLVVLLLVIFFGPTIRPLLPFLFPPPQKKISWHPDTEKNLKTLYTGMMLQHDSDGQFPKSSQWMELVIKRVRTETLKKGEEAKKFVDPAAGGAPGVYGFAMNDAASEKYKDDLKDKQMPLIFESTETAWNAHGDPAKIGRKGGIGVDLDGKIVRL